MAISAYFQSRQQRVDAVLQQLLPSQSHSPAKLHKAMHYVVLNGGKRLRPILVYATGEIFGVDLDHLDAPASAIELIHAYSLVHDDLPAMDDDELRRGQPTCHRAFDEATAILTGDALQTLAFSVLADHADLLNVKTRLAMISCLAKAAGSVGMAGGQALDLGATGQQLNQQELEEIHHLKTGALITASIQLGAMAADIHHTPISTHLIEFAKKIGLCFQIQDDILNAEGNVTTLGKGAGTDHAKQKATYATMNDVSFAKKCLQEHYDEAINALKPLGEKADLLRELATFIIQRNH